MSAPAVAAAILALAASAQAASVAAAAPEDLRFDADDGIASDAVDHRREIDKQWEAERLKQWDAFANPDN